MDKYNYYAHIGVFKNKDYKHFSLIIDSNTAINLEKYYYNPSKLGEKKLMATRDFLISNIHTDPVYGFALQETCWDYQRFSLNMEQYRKMESALVQQYSWSEKKIISHARSKGIQYDGTPPQREKVSEIHTLINQLECNPFLTASYASVMKIMILQKKSNKNKMDLIEEYVDFVNNQLIGELALETQIAFLYFLGEPKMQEIGDKIFKFDSKKMPVLLNAWNTAWDLFYLRLLQRCYFDREFMNTVAPKLVTADKGIINLASLCSLETAIITNDAPIPILSFDDNNIRAEYIHDATRINKELYYSSIQREMKRKSLTSIDNHVIEIATKLEKELVSIS